MLAELGGKGGCLCEPARAGTLRCPLIVRPTSEDVITGELFGVLKNLNPRWWLADFLNRALGTERFRRQYYRDLRIELWQKQPPPPKHLTPWEEGNTEVDVLISWENPATTVFIEMKYGSPVSSKTARNNGYQGYPADQLIRNARIGLWKTGWFAEERLFEVQPRDFVLLLVAPEADHPLVARYRNPETLKSSIPHGELLHKLPRGPFIGELSYRGVISLLKERRSRFTPSERRQIDQLIDYLWLKISTLPRKDHPSHG